MVSISEQSGLFDMMVCSSFFFFSDKRISGVGVVRATHKTLNAHRCDLRSLKCLRNSAAFQGLLSEPSSMVTGFEVLLSSGTFPKTVATSASTFFMYAAFSRASTVTVESEERARKRA